LDGKVIYGRNVVMQFYTTLLSLVSVSKTSLDERITALREEDSERGAISLETVAIAAGLLAVALLLVAGITAAVTGRLGGIN